MRAVLAICGLAALLAVAQAAGPAKNDICSECQTAVRVLKDLLCDSEVEATAADWIIENVCPSTGNKQSCADIVNGIAPALFDWLRLGTDAQEMCAEVGVCGAQRAAGFLPVKQAKARRARSAPRANDMGCPLCMFVVGKVKDGLSDPVTREEIKSRTAAACGGLPEGPMRDTCNDWAAQYEETLFQFVDKTEPSDLCAMLGSCSLLDKLPALPQPSAALVRALAPLAGRAAALRSGAAAAPSNDNCETCKTVIKEMHSAVANPDLQEQITDYAKAACDALGQSLAENCKEHVDQYAPMAFGMILAYLQPETVCRQMHMCPPPSLAGQLLDSVARSLAPGRFEGLLLRGQPLAGGRHVMRPADALRLPMHA